MPQLLGDVGGHRRQQLQQRIDQLAHYSRVPAARGPVAIGVIDELVQTRYGGVEREPLEVLTHYLDRAVHLARERLVEGRLVQVCDAPDSAVVLAQPPHALQPRECDTADRQHTLFRPVEVLLRRAGEQHVEAVSYTHLRAHETDSYLVCR